PLLLLPRPPERVPGRNREKTLGDRRGVGGVVTLRPGPGAGPRAPAGGAGAAGFGLGVPGSGSLSSVSVRPGDRVDGRDSTGVGLGLRPGTTTGPVPVPAPPPEGPISSGTPSVGAAASGRRTGPGPAGSSGGSGTLRDWMRPGALMPG